MLGRTQLMITALDDKRRKMFRCRVREHRA